MLVVLWSVVLLFDFTVEACLITTCLRCDACVKYIGGGLLNPHFALNCECPHHLWSGLILLGPPLGGTRVIYCLEGHAYSLVRPLL